MSLEACLPGLEADGKLSPEQAANARELYDELVAEHVRTGSPEAAAALASEGVLAALERQVTRKQFLAGRTIRARQRIAADIGGYGDGRDGGGGGPIDPRAGPALLDHDPRARFSNVEGRRKAILGQAHRRIDAILAQHSTNLFGKVRDKAGLADLVREAFGEATGNRSAKDLAGAWRESAEMLRRRFNRAGGDVGYRADWGLPQSHDWKAVRKAGFEAWRDFTLPMLAPERMIDTRTGLPFTAQSLELALRDVWETIRTNGWSKRTPGGSAGVKSIANRRSDARFLVFKSADDWMAYAEQFGHGTAYDAMMGHIEGMARDTAAMEVLGPNPNATIDWLKGTLEESAAKDASPDARGVQDATAATRKIDDLWNEYTGANLEVGNERVAKFMSGVRAFQTSTKLGSALLSATSDFVFQNARRGFNGLGQASQLPQYLKLMKPGSIEDQKLAVRRGLIAEEWASRTAGQSRYLMEELVSQRARRLAEGVLRLSLLSRHTQAMRWVYGMETLATYTEAAGKSLDELHPKLRGALDRYGIDAKDWDALRSAPMDTDRGVEWISPHNLEDQELASRFMEMIHEETDIAVPTADLGTRAMLNTLGRRGTAVGEIARSVFLFKSFGVSVILRQAGEIMAMQRPRAVRYAGGMIIGTTLAGALAIQLKAIAAGKDPRPMDDAPHIYDEQGELDPNGGFWGAAMLQGGGFGIFGDFFFASTNRQGGGLAATIAGPLAGDIQTVTNAALSKHRERAVIRAAKGFIPGNNLWYTRLAFDRLVADQIQQAIDPEYDQSWQRLDRYAAEQGTSFYWRPGAAAPERAPDFANALEEGPEQ